MLGLFTKINIKYLKQAGVKLESVWEEEGLLTVIIKGDK